MAEELGVIELDQNLSDTEKPLELPAGSYVGEIQSIEVLDSKAGNQYYAIKFKIAPDEIAADVRDEFEDGATLFWNRQIVPKAKDRRALYNLRQFIEAIGLDANTTTIDPNEWMGQTATLRVRHTKYQGVMRAEIASIEPSDAPAPAREKTTRRAPEPEEVEEAPAPRRGRPAAATGRRGR